MNICWLRYITLEYVERRQTSAVYSVQFIGFLRSRITFWIIQSLEYLHLSANKLTNTTFSTRILTRPRVNECTTFILLVNFRQSNSKLIILKTVDRNILKSENKHVLCYKNKLLLLSILIFHWSTSSTTAVWSPLEPRPLTHPTPQVARCMQPLFIQLSVRWKFHSIPRFCLLFKLFNHSRSPLHLE